MLFESVENHEIHGKSLKSNTRRLLDHGIRCCGQALALVLCQQTTGLLMAANVAMICRCYFSCFDGGDDDDDHDADIVMTWLMETPH